MPRLTTGDRRRATGSKARPKTGRAERDYSRSLSQIARHVGDLVNGFPVGAQELPTIMDILERYAVALTPWAKHTAKRMIEEVNARDWDTWKSLGLAISQTLRSDIQNTPVGVTMRGLLDENVNLITSLPREAALRVHKLTLEGLLDSTRAREIAKEIGRSGEVTKSRALLIARTEISRTATILSQARSEQAGVTHYVWRTAHDQDVREGHKAMEGKVCEWRNPPAVLENGKIMHFHAGEIWNCRCYPEPIVTL